MNITKRDVLELRRRLKKTECTISRLSGCYVGGSKNIVLQFSEPFLDLEDDEFHKYLEIAKKALSGTLGNNLMELEFQNSEQAALRQQFLLALKASKLQNPDMLDRLYEQIIEHYACAGNYLILVFHDIYDVMARTTDRAKLDESSEIYEYLICAVCPVELSKPGLGYREEENRIGARERDWVVGVPELGFVYPAFIDRGSDTNAVMYYIKNSSASHPEFAENVLGCNAQRTATEEKNAFASLVKNAFDEDDEQAEAAFLKIQRNLNEIVVEQEEEEDAPPVCLTANAVSDVISDVPMPDPVKQQITRAYAQMFGDTPPAAQNLVDAKLVATSAQRERTLALEQQVTALRAKLDGQQPYTDVPHVESGADAPLADIVLQVPPEKAAEIHPQVINGRKCLVIPLKEGESACINGANAQV